ncbi:MAG: hypothetical protein QOD08_1738 [Gaiellaceae bacterium]|jgi:uncharacterized glyoxalase superfamily protein PhnB|nr:hypothetical protein [Gaiellaceae bacterium]MDX6483362.1 hypothetical protein [Gaiellaceae bacterium]
MSLPAVTPMISYEDAGAAADWLALAFGFEETLRYTEESGKVSHVELRLGDGAIMLGSPPGYVNPLHLRETEAGGAWNETAFVIDGVHVYVEDVDAHFAHARAAGATILSELEDQPFGDRQYRAEDLEGHRWMFATHVRDVPPEDWGAETV